VSGLLSCGVAVADCVVVISHDRWFLDRIATHILAFEVESNVTFFDGTVRRRASRDSFPTSVGARGSRAPGGWAERRGPPHSEPGGTTRAARRVTCCLPRLMSGDLAV